MSAQSEQVSSYSCSVRGEYNANAYSAALNHTDSLLIFIFSGLHPWGLVPFSSRRLLSGFGRVKSTSFSDKTGVFPSSDEREAKTSSNRWVHPTRSWHAWSMEWLASKLTFKELFPSSSPLFSVVPTRRLQNTATLSCSANNVVMTVSCRQWCEASNRSIKNVNTEPASLITIAHQHHVLVRNALSLLANKTSLGDRI